MIMLHSRLSGYPQHTTCCMLPTLRIESKQLLHSACGSIWIIKGLGAAAVPSVQVQNLSSDPHTSVLVILTCSWRVWKLMFINTVAAFGELTKSRSLFLVIFIENVARAHRIFLLFIFIAAWCLYQACPLHPPPTINNPDRCRDSAALLVWCFETGIPTIFKDQHTCASGRSPAYRLVCGCSVPMAMQPAALCFWWHPVFSVCSYFYSSEMHWCSQKPHRWISDFTSLFLNSLQDVVFLHSLQCNASYQTVLMVNNALKTAFYYQVGIDFLS